LSADDRVQGFHSRNLLYQQRGLDRTTAARFVVASGGVLRGPALDVGTGKGLLAIELARAGLDVVSVDLDDVEQELAALLSAEAGVEERIHLVHGDAADLSYPDGHFGCVAMMDVLHHLDEPGPVLREMVRVLDLDGIAIVADFDEGGFELVSSVHGEGGGEHSRSATTLVLAQDELARAGLQTVLRTAGHFHDVVVLRKAR
jgi:ubiquinone/menaquinone biosynthesis C-methylase UbiE